MRTQGDQTVVTIQTENKNAPKADMNAPFNKQNKEKFENFMNRVHQTVETETDEQLIYRVQKRAQFDLSCYDYNNINPPRGNSKGFSNNFFPGETLSQVTHGKSL